MVKLPAQTESNWHLTALNTFRNWNFCSNTSL